MKQEQIDKIADLLMESDIFRNRTAYKALATHLFNSGCRFADGFYIGYETLKTSGGPWEGEPYRNPIIKPLDYKEGERE